jgi:hypothetical protein
MSGKGFLRSLLSDLPVKVICLTAAVILFLFHRVNTMTERFFSVPLEVSTPPGLAIGSAYPKTVRITLRGTEDAIYPILEEDIQADASLDGHRSAGVFRVPVRITRRGTAANVEPLEIKVEPAEVTFALEPLAERRVPVEPNLRGAPAYGYQVVQSSVAPESILVRGARSRVQALSSLSTEEVDLSGRTASFSLRVKVLAPSSLVRIVGDAAVDFHAIIQESVISRAISGVPILGSGIPAHLALRSALPLGTVTLQGTQLALDSVQAGQVKLVLDLSAIHRAGEYTLHPRPETPAGFAVLDWSPREVTVDLAASGR